MEHLTRTDRFAATVESRNRLARQIVRQIWLVMEPKLILWVTEFLQPRWSPRRFFEFEVALLGIVRELGQRLLEATLNRLEPDSSADQISEL